MEEDRGYWLSRIAVILFAGVVAEGIVMVLTDNFVISGIGPFLALCLFVVWGIEQMDEDSLGSEL